MRCSHREKTWQCSNAATDGFKRCASCRAKNRARHKTPQYRAWYRAYCTTDSYRVKQNIYKKTPKARKWARTYKSGTKYRAWENTYRKLPHVLQKTREANRTSAFRQKRREYQRTPASLQYSRENHRTPGYLAWARKRRKWRRQHESGYATRLREQARQRYAKNRDHINARRKERNEIRNAA